MGNIVEDFCLNPLINSHFLLRVDAVYDLPCRKITGLSQTKEYETIQAGGVNDHVFLREKPASKPHTFKVERYIGVDFFDPLPVGKQPALPIMLYISRYLRDFENAKQTFMFKGCTVMSKTFSDLNAEQGSLMIETTEIAYQQVEIVINSKEDTTPKHSARTLS